jgi:ubiquinone/menaquinone biosynthesis C-methylase UbiE
MTGSMKDHWNKVYSSREVSKLGWYLEKPEHSLKLLSNCEINKDDPVLDVGVGASKFIDSLIENGYNNITAIDISEVALDKLKERIGEEKASKIEWIVDNITRPEHIDKLENIAVWHDRAVLHFLVDEAQQDAYFQTLKKVVRVNGYAIISAFSKEGAKKCSGLDVVNYDKEMIAEKLGDDFSLVESFDHTHIMPSGDHRPYVYTLFKRIK